MALFLRALLGGLLFCGSSWAASVTHTGPVISYLTYEDNEGEIQNVIPLVEVSRYELWDVNLGVDLFLSCAPANTYAGRWVQITFAATGNTYRGITWYMEDDEGNYLGSASVDLTGTNYTTNCLYAVIAPSTGGDWSLPLPPNGTPLDYDGDSIPDDTDPDDDNDGVPDGSDSQPKNPNVPGGGPGPGDPPGPPGGDPPVNPPGPGDGEDDPEPPADPGGPEGFNPGTGTLPGNAGSTFTKLVGSWNAYKPTSQTGATVSFAVTLPGQGSPTTYTVSSIPDTSTTHGNFLNVLRLLLRSFLTVLLLYKFFSAVYRLLAKG